jgi:Ricin-type beta-trefoil lectin domain-like
VLAESSVSRRGHLAAFAAAAAMAVISLCTAATAEAGTIVGPGGPSVEYSSGGASCSADPADPVGVLFRGRAGRPSNVSKAISYRTGFSWDHTENYGAQGLTVHQADGSYDCRLTDAANASATARLPNSRTHVRLWFVPGSVGGGEAKTVGTPHHEDWITHACAAGVICTDDHCVGEVAIDVMGNELSGNHAVDEGGVRQGKDSGFDRGRQELRRAFEPKYKVGVESWGNTAEIEQCDNDWAGSHGAGVTIWLDNSMHTHVGTPFSVTTSGAVLNGKFYTEEPGEYWFAYGFKSAQAASGYPYSTPVKSMSGGIEELNVNQAVSGLAPGTRYYVRLFARNQYGEVEEGNEASFKTCSPLSEDDDQAPGPRAIAQCNRTVDVFYRTPEGKLGHNWFDTGGLGWQNGDLPASIAPSAVPHAVGKSNGTIDVFYRTASGGLGHNWFDTGGAGWQSGNLPGSVASDPHAIVQANGTIDVFYRTPSGGLGHNWFDPGGAGWLTGNLPGAVASDPHAVVQGNGTIDVFYRTPANELGHAWFDTGGSGWHSGNLPGSLGSDPHAVVQPNGTVDVFYRTPTGALGHDWFDTGGSGWHAGNLPGSLASDPHVTVQANGTVDVFYRTPSGELGHNWFDTGGLGWQSGNLPGVLASDPHAVVQGNGTVDVFYRTPSGELGHDWFDVGGAGWLSGNLPANMATDPHVVVQSDGTIDVFYRTSEGKLGHNWFDTGGSGWQAGDLPGAVAAGTPRLTTASVTAITTGSATLNGAVNPEGLETSYRFQYGPTASYGFSAPASAQKIGAGTVDVAVSQTAAGLAQGTTYHYRLVATNREGSTYGSDRTFKTAGPGPTETSLSVTRTLSGQPGYVSVSGTVKADSSLAGQKVNIRYEKETSPGVYSLAVSVERELSAAGAYAYENQPVGQGNWRAKAEFKGGTTFPPSSSGYQSFHVGLGYQLKFAHSNKCIDVQSGSVANGALLQQWDCLDPSTHLNQVFQLVPTSGPWYQVRNINSGRCIDVTGASTANGARLQQWDCSPSYTHQLFQLVQLGGGWAALQAAHDLKCIDVNSSSTASGTILQQWDCHWGSNQQVGFFSVG